MSLVGSVFLLFASVRIQRNQWHIAKRFIKKNLDRDWEKYQELRKELEMPDLNEERKNQILDELKALKEGSYSENFVKEIDQTLNRT